MEKERVGRVEVEERKKEVKSAKWFSALSRKVF
jgi:hypothetical protein